MSSKNTNIKLSHAAICLSLLLAVTLILSLGFYGKDLFSNPQAQKAMLLSLVAVSITTLLIFFFTLWRYNTFMQGFIEDQAECDRVLEEAKITEKALHDSNEVLLSLVQASPLAIITFDSSWKIETWNRAAELMFGWNSDEVEKMGNPIIPEERRDEFKKIFDETRLGESKVGIEVVCKRKDGAELDISFSIAPLRDENGYYTKAVAVLKDITKRKEVEEALKKAKVDAEQENKNQSNFLAYMSHELKTPVTGIAGLVELLSRSKLDENQKDYIRMIKNGCGSILEISNDILDFSKIKAGKLEIARTPFRIKDCIDEVFELVAHRAKEKKLDLIYSIDEDVPEFIKSDPIRIRQILLNLIGNALKFTSKGKIFLSVENKFSNSEFAELLFSVSDTGIGIAKEHIPCLFRSFSQLGPSANGKYGGSGLGLVICKQLTELMDGKIWVDSKLGKGSTFSFTIKTFNLSPEECIPPEEENKSESASTKRGLKILLAEDDSISRKVQLEMLKEIGYDADVVPNGQEVLDAVKKENYNLIFMDINMPQLDGVEATRRIKESEKSGKLKNPAKIIAVTCKAGDDDKARYLEAGMDDLIPKPFSIEDFKTAVEKWGGPIDK